MLACNKTKLIFLALIFFNILNYCVGAVAFEQFRSLGGPFPKPKSKKQAVRKFQRITITYYGVLYGPSLGAPGYSSQINPTTSQIDPTYPVVLQNQLALNYKFTPDFFVGPLVDFNLNLGQTNDSIMQDVGGRIGLLNFLRPGLVSLFGDLRVLWPVSNVARNQNASFIYESTFFLNWKLGGLPFYLGFFGIEKYHTYYNYNNPAQFAYDFDLFFEPMLTWRFSRNVGAAVAYDSYPARQLGQSNWNFSAPNDVYLGLTWDPVEALSIYPGFLIYPVNPSLADVGTIVYFRGSIL